LNVPFDLYRRDTLVSLPWNQVAKQHWLTTFVGGVFLLVLGTTKGIPAWGLAADAPFHYVLIVVGVALLLVAIVFMWLAFHRTTTSGPKPKFEPNKYFSTITSPAEDSKLLPPVTVKGKLKRALPANVELCLCSEARVGVRSVLYPQSTMEFIDKVNWTSVYNPGEYKDGQRRTLRLFFVGKDGQALIALYKKANDRLPKGEPWTPITDRAADMYPASDELHVILQKPPGAKP
jgi:hypothetical protein